MSYKTVAIVGASGLLGKHMVKQLAKGGFELTLISRDSKKLKETFNLISDVKFKQVEPDDAQGLKEALEGIRRRN
jgi:short-subunit dehydrogenase